MHTTYLNKKTKTKSVVIAGSLLGVSVPESAIAGSSLAWPLKMTKIWAAATMKGQRGKKSLSYGL